MPVSVLGPMSGPPAAPSLGGGGDCHMTTTERADLVRVCSLADLERDGVRVASVGGRRGAVLRDGGRVSAIDTRCPHMGFPLHGGSVRDGILPCHWHHAKFELASGCTFDLFADDVPAFRVEVAGGEV